MPSRRDLRIERRTEAGHERGDIMIDDDPMSDISRPRIEDAH
jgi:hypothetical protein